mgnify:CR=1 FL=1
MPAGKRPGFTLVELLVVIAIIGLLMALLLPAVQGARESARRLHCGNNVAQMAKAALTHEATNRFFPSGGWGYFWVGDPDRGFGRGQPGGWLFSCLPYLEQTAIWNLAADGDPMNIGATQTAGAVRMVRTLLPTVNCPSRRPLQLLPKPSNGTFVAWNCGANSSDNVVARADYAVNAGTMLSGGYNASYWYVPATNTIESQPSPSAQSAVYYDWPGGGSGGGAMAKYPDNITFPGANVTLDGISFNLSEVTAADITDGASLCYLLGERNCNPDEYFTGTSGCDNETWVQGTNNDMLRSGYNPPLQDTRGVSPCGGFLFGSAHATSFAMAFADGAVRWIRYDIDRAVHFALSDRMDGAVIPGNAVR